MSAETIRIWHGNPRGERFIECSLDIPPEITLGILCAGIYEIDKLVRYLDEQATTNPNEVVSFVDSFLSAVVAELDLNDSYLRVNEAAQGGRLDFQRPSPSLLMLRRFVETLSKRLIYRDVLRKHVMDLRFFNDLDAN